MELAALELSVVGYHKIGNVILQKVGFESIEQYILCLASAKIKCRAYLDTMFDITKLDALDFEVPAMACGGSLIQRARCDAHSAIFDARVTVLMHNILYAHPEGHAAHLRTENYAHRNRPTNLAADKGSEYASTLLSPRCTTGGYGLDR